MRRERGFTLIEVMVVLAIIGLIVGLGTHGLRSLAKSDLRESSAHLSGAMRYLFDRASTTGKIHRLVVDMDSNQYWAEVSDDKFYIPREAESEQAMRRREEKEADEDAEEQRKLERTAKAYDDSSSSSSGSSSSSSSFDPSKLEVGDFKPKRARFAAFKEIAIKPVRLKKAQIRSVYTPRQTDPLTSGRAYVYFFPLGQTEPAIVTLSNGSEPPIYSLVVHPITGRVRIYDQEVLPPAGRERFDDEGARVEP
jgi:general secretion pathway protein H